LIASDQRSLSLTLSLTLPDLNLTILASIPCLVSGRRSEPIIILNKLTNMNVLWIRNCGQNCQQAASEQCCTWSSGRQADACVHSPDGNTFLCKISSCPWSSKVWCHKNRPWQLMHIYLTTILPNFIPIWFDLRRHSLRLFFEEVAPTRTTTRWVAMFLI